MHATTPLKAQTKTCTASYSYKKRFLMPLSWYVAVSYLPRRERSGTVLAQLDMDCHRPADIQDIPCQTFLAAIAVPIRGQTEDT